MIFDGVDRAVYHGLQRDAAPAGRRSGSRGRSRASMLPPDTRVVTYVSRGFESMRGFDIFMRAAKLIYEQYPDVLFFVVGTDRIAYGGDENYIGGKTFKEWVAGAGPVRPGPRSSSSGGLTPRDLGKAAGSKRSAHLSDGAVRADLEHDGCDELRRGGARQSTRRP